MEKGVFGSPSTMVHQLIYMLFIFYNSRLNFRDECPGYYTKQSDGEVPVMHELWGMQSISSLPLLPGPLWPGVVAPDRALSMG